MIFITVDLHGHHDITSMASRKTLKFLLMFVFAMITVSIINTF